MARIRVMIRKFHAEDPDYVPEIDWSYFCAQYCKFDKICKIFQPKSGNSFYEFCPGFANNSYISDFTILGVKNG